MKDARFPKFVLLVNGLVPMALLGWDARRGQLGANPLEYGLRTTGMLALVFLMLSLTVTPARKITGYNFLSHFRRMLGLFAFTYALLHLTIYFVFDRSLSLRAVIGDTFARPFILLGMCAFFMLVPLAITSTNGWIKRLGAAQWKRLHSLAYFAAIAGVFHYYRLVKANVNKPVAFAIVLGLLLGFRLVYAAWKKTAPRPAQVAS